MGIFFRNENNVIEFESFQQENLLLDSFGLEATSLTPSDAEEEKETKDTEEPLTDIDEESLEAEENLGATQVMSHEEIRESTPLKNDPVLEKVVETTIMQEEPDDSQKKKKRGWLWLFLIFIPVIVAGFFLYNKQNRNAAPVQITEKKPVPDTEINKSENMISSDTVKKDTAFAETIGNMQAETANNETIASDTIENKGNYYLVGGSFKEEENAEKFMNEFNAEGYTPFQLGKRGNFYIVAIGKFNTEKEAFAAQNEFIKKNPDAGTWVYKDETK